MKKSLKIIILAFVMLTDITLVYITYYNNSIYKAMMVQNLH